MRDAYFCKTLSQAKITIKKLGMKGWYFPCNFELTREQLPITFFKNPDKQITVFACKSYQQLLIYQVETHAPFEIKEIFDSKIKIKVKC